jgi:hypothetical protein
MAITRPKPKTPDEFVAAAPDAPTRKGVKRGRKEQITLTLAPDMLVKVDALAARMGQSRAAVINLAIFRLIEAEG